MNVARRRRWLRSSVLVATIAAIAMPAVSPGIVAAAPNASLISATTPTVAEGDAGDVTLRYAVTLDRPSGSTVTVDVATADYVATVADGDYDAVPLTTLSFAPGETVKTVDVTVHGDTRDEGDLEWFHLVLSNPTGAADFGGGNTTQTFTAGYIYDDDPTLPNASLISATTPTVAEGDAGDVTLRYAVTLDRPSGSTVTVDVATADYVATVADGDYDAVPLTTLSFAPGETVKTVDVTVHGDTRDEGDLEWFHLVLSNPTGAADFGGGNTTQTFTAGYIYDDDPTLPNASLISATTPTVAEGDAGDVTLRYAVTLDRPSGSTVTVDVATADYVATVADGDYDAVPLTTLSFAPGETVKTVDVTVHGDTRDEGDLEWFHLVLSNPTGAADFGGGNTTQTFTAGYIYDDDPTLPNASLISATTPTVAEGDAGDVTLRYAVTLDRPSGSTVTVDVATADYVATVADGDYDAVPLTTLSFAPGETVKTVDVTVHGDTRDEGDLEWFHLVLSNPTGAADFGGGNTTQTFTAGYIYDDDGVGGPVPAAQFSVRSASVVEGDTGVVTMRFAVVLDRILDSTATVKVETQDGGASSADGDYDAVPLTTLSFAPGETVKTVDVTVHGDTLDEGEQEGITLAASAPTGATIPFFGGSVTGTIFDDDITPVPAAQFSVRSASVVEGDTGVVTMRFAVVLDRILGSTATVKVETQDGGASSADGDYDAVPLTTLSFAPGETVKTVDVTVHGDTLDEGEQEGITLAASAPTGATIPFFGGSVYRDDLRRRHHARPGRPVLGPLGVGRRGRHRRRDHALRGRPRPDPRLDRDGQGRDPGRRRVVRRRRLRRRPAHDPQLRPGRDGQDRRRDGPRRHPRRGRTGRDHPRGVRADRRDHPVLRRLGHRDDLRRRHHARPGRPVLGPLGVGRRGRHRRRDHALRGRPRPDPRLDRDGQGRDGRLRCHGRGRRLRRDPLVDTHLRCR